MRLSAAARGVNVPENKNARVGPGIFIDARSEMDQLT